jgi:hypothetical protein
MLPAKKIVAPSGVLVGIDVILNVTCAGSESEPINKKKRLIFFITAVKFP